MHILIIPSERYLPKGSPLSGIFQKEEAHALKRKGFKVGIISPFEIEMSYTVQPIRLFQRLSLFRPKGCISIKYDKEIPVLKYCGQPAFFNSISFLNQSLIIGEILFKQYMKRYGKPDIIHAHNAQYAGGLVSHIKKKYNIPYALTEHSSAYILGSITDSDMVAIRDAFKNADKRLVISPHLGCDLERVVGNVVKPWEYLPNILPYIFENTISEIDKPLKSKTEFMFLSVGALEENKGHSYLLQAFAKYFRNQNGIFLKIVGEGPLRTELLQLSHRLGIEKQTIFLGLLPHEKVLKEMKNCDIFIHPSRYETFGVVLIEALSCGKPVVATICGGPECIIHKENGILVPIENVAVLGEAMITLKANILQYDSHKIRNDCLMRFGKNTIVARLLDTYEYILKSSATYYKNL